MIEPKPGAIYDQCPHCGAITIWRYRTEEPGAEGEGGDYQCQGCRCCSQPVDEVTDRHAAAVANLGDHEPFPTSDN